MIKTSELRIGNIVKDHYGYIEVTSLRRLIFDNQIHPVEITEQILLEKCGFTKGDYGDGIYPEYKGPITIVRKSDVFYLWVHVGEDSFYSFPWVEIKSLHQLQNLVFALTNKDLTVKL